MKPIFNALSALILISATIVAPANAAVSPDVFRNVQSAAGDFRVYVRVQGDTVTLSGWVDDYYARSQAERAAKASGATRVINCIFVE